MSHARVIEVLGRRMAFAAGPFARECHLLEFDVGALCATTRPLYPLEPADARLLTLCPACVAATLEGDPHA